MKAPNTVNTETKYYTITLFKYRNYYGETLPTVYPDNTTAMRIFEKLVATKKYYSIIAREEIVYIRNENTELSTSTPIAKYEDNYDFADFILDMEDT